ncbi:MAG: hypothetical protein A4E49_01400 [Methanosaeta sp. PtaU1.Bin112]|nr:MAG: hypothetical protein A4E49_01400 [Methanosaeta sp. PtaU1.Bin112]
MKRLLTIFRRSIENAKSGMAMQTDLQNRDDLLKREAARVRDERKSRGLDGLVGGLQAVIINTESHLQRAAAEELIRYSGLQFKGGFVDSGQKTCVLRVPGSDKFRSADFLIRCRLKGENPFSAFNIAPQTGGYPNTRLETFIFETRDIESYVTLQSQAGFKFQSGILDFGNYYFVQTVPSQFTGNSLGFIEWKGKRGDYSTAESQSMEGKAQSSVLSADGDLKSAGSAVRSASISARLSHLRNIRWLDHAATRVRAQDRDPAILEFMRLTNYNFDFAIYVRSLNSITNVARLSSSDFAMVFTSGIAPFVSPQASGPTEKFISNFGPRVHHIAFQTEEIDATVEALRRDGMQFLLDLVGSPEEGLKQIFSQPSRNTLLVTEYIHRYGGFDGFFTKSNVTSLTKATENQ